ncbi:MAG TPA: VCBS repeat-containing protein, partial [Candidatus Dormibacteraeota bacterium]|nr:VCBS repeat-containing protein [Candidatus Dormibacteraeota bacterium]
RNGAGGGSLSFAAGDLNGDGVTDLVVVDGTGSVVERLGIGDGSFGPARTIRVEACEDYYCYPVTAVIDVNADGFADVVLWNEVLLGHGDGTFAEPVAGGARGLLVDVDGDGYLDNIDGGFDVRLGGADGIFAGGLAFASGGSCGGIASADLNADGAPDFVCAIAPNWGDGSGDSADRVSVALNVGDAAFAMPRVLPAPEAPLVVAAADVNGDGRIDLLTAGQCSQIGRPSCDGTAALSIWLAAP